MKISSSLNTTDKQQTYRSFKGFPAQSIILPEVVGDIGRFVGNNIGTPEQKLIVASTAALLRPFVDLKYAEEDKKIDTAIKSTSKALAGGLTGVTIRAGFITLMNSLIKFPGANYVHKKVEELETIDYSKGLKGIANKTVESEKFRISEISRLLLPLDLVNLNTEEKVKSMHRLKQFNNSLGGLIAVIVMAIFTNSKLDAPLTSDFQDILTAIIKEKKPVGQSIITTVKKRYNKIKNWTDEKKDRITKFFKKTNQLINIITDKTE